MSGHHYIANKTPLFSLESPPRRERNFCVRGVRFPRGKGRRYDVGRILPSFLHSFPEKIKRRRTRGGRKRTRRRRQEGRAMNTRELEFRHEGEFEGWACSFPFDRGSGRLLFFSDEKRASRTREPARPPSASRPVFVRSEWTIDARVVRKFHAILFLSFSSQLVTIKHGNERSYENN